LSPLELSHQPERALADIGDRVRGRVLALSAADRALGKLLRALDDAGPVWVIGGAARDWVLGLPPRDLDLMVDGPSAAVAYALRD
jgi:hypothetical protein